MSQTRQDILKSIRDNPDVDVLIIGGGINGIGTFRDLAHQGVNVLLVEKGDFCSGASAASSHMLHGGIRYLENGEFRLVREALTERNLMLKNAPHYARPLPTIIPMFRWFSGMFNAPLKFVGLRDKPSERGALVIKIGLIFYDIFARSYKVMPNHEMYGKQEALRRHPHVNKDIVAMARYYDSFMPYPERICIELLQDGEAAAPNARSVNYVKAVNAEIDTVILSDELTGETYRVKPKIVINAAGPWIDFANRDLGHATRFIGGTKGSHIVVRHPELREAAGDGEFFFENQDGRIVLILPYVDNTVMIGTTDIRIEDPEEAVCTPDEIDYMLNLVSRVFPNIKVNREYIVFHFSGVRPLPASEKGFTGNVSRDHSIRTVEADGKIHFPVYSLIGGKWTTFRAFSEQTADTVMKRLGIPRKISTAQMPLGGGKDYPATEAEQQAWLERLQARTELDMARLRLLFERYGSHAAEIAAFMSAESDAPLTNQPNFTRREILYLTRTEKVVRLDDVVLRRTLLAWLGGFTDELLLELADILANELGWSADQTQVEVERASQILREQHGVEMGAPVDIT
jgi:glycerol-3-phosphate dehydrogenase